MVFWEAIRRTHKLMPRSDRPRSVPRLPYETRCAAKTRTGHRCRGTVKSGSEFCLFHDPVVAEKRRLALAKSRRDPRRRLSHLPDGYLRKLNSRAAVGEAMDRLYRELRLGTVTTEMGAVLFGILTRILDEQLFCKPHPAPNGRARADRVRPVLAEKLTRAERASWRQAVANAPEAFVMASERQPDPRPQPPPQPEVQPRSAERSVARAILAPA